MNNKKKFFNYFLPVLFGFLLFESSPSFSSEEDHFFSFGKSFTENRKRSYKEESKGIEEEIKIKEIIDEKEVVVEFVEFKYSKTETNRSENTKDALFLETIIDIEHSEKVQRFLSNVFRENKKARTEGSSEEHLEVLRYPGIDRRLIVNDVKEFPWSCYGRLRVTFASTDPEKPAIIGIGSGFMISPRCVLTCAHNLYLNKKVSLEYNYIKRSFVQAVFLPGLEGDKIDVLFDFLNSKGFNKNDLNVNSSFINAKWIESEDVNEDLALLRLEGPIGKELGYLAPAEIETTGILSDVVLNVTGYPGELGDYMYTMKGKVTSVDDGKVFYDIDTTRGNSGSCIWKETNRGPLFVGVHTTGKAGGFNGGVCTTTKHRINEIGNWLRIMKE